MPKKKTTEPAQTTVVSGGKFFLSLGVLLLVIVVLLLSIMGYIGFKIHQYVNAFTTAGNTSVSEVVKIAREGWETQPKMEDSRVNILLLGTDEVANRVDDPVLTDTLMLLSLDTTSGKLSALNLPRDLWIPEYQTKINALYWYGRDHNPEHPEQFTQQVVQDLTQVPIHYTVVVSLDTVAEVIDALGGLNVNVFAGFTDEFFPRGDVDIRTEKDPAKLYQTVVFTQGIEKMTGERALQYMRSRKSQNIETGTDDARSIRQQQVIGSLMERLKDQQLLKDPATLGRLFSIYNTAINNYFPMTDAIGLGKLIRSDIYDLEFSPSTLSIQSPISQGVIIHPPVNKYDQWVYEVWDLEAFRFEVSEHLNLR